MNKPFAFADFVDEFKVPFTYIEKTDGYYNDAGDWIEGGEVRTDMYGIVLPLSEDDLQYAEAGAYQAKDRKVYTTKPLKMGAEIEFKVIATPFRISKITATMRRCISTT